VIAAINIVASERVFETCRLVWRGDFAWLERISLGVMAGLVPAIHVFLAEKPARKARMPATGAGMTPEG